MVFESIRLVKPRQLFIAADGPRRHVQGEAELCLQTRQIVSKIDWPCELRTKFSETNQGCKLSVSSALDWFFEQVEEGIILEDDCLPDPTFYSFCENMLGCYKDDNRIMMISGTNYLFDKAPIEESYFFSRYYAIWGWATWKRAWEKCDLHMKSWPGNKATKQLLYLFGDRVISKFYTDMFDNVYRNKTDSWGIPWAYSCIFQNGLAIVPVQNLISNIGTQGTHTGNTPSPFLRMPLGKFDIDRINHPSGVAPNGICDKRTYRNVLTMKNNPRALLRCALIYLHLDFIFKPVRFFLKNANIL